MFSLILESSCLAAMPRLTNSTTACEDWQSHIPEPHLSVAVHALYVTIWRRTITSNNKELVVVGNRMSNNVGKCRYNLLLRRELSALLEFEISDSSGQRKVAVDTTKIDEASGSTYSSFLS